jgi:hypothetical protein
MSKSVLLGIGTAVVVVMLASTITSTPVSATPAFAAQTGKPCGACHVSPSGGGKLTAAGEKFKASKK